MADEYLSTDPNAGAEPEQSSYLSTDPNAGAAIFGDRRDLVAQSLQDSGASPAVQAAIMGDIHQESEFHPRLVDDGGTSVGLLQVGVPLFRQFEQDQARQGIGPRDPRYTYNQVPYILDRFKQQHPDRWEAMQNAPSGAAALQIFRGTKDWGYGIAGRRYQYAQNYEQALKGVPVEQVDQEVRVEKAIPVKVREMEVARALPAQGPKPQTTHEGGYISTDPNAGSYISTDPDAGLAEQENALATAGATRISQIASDLLQDPNAITPPTQTYPVPQPVVPGNIDLTNRPVVQNADGTVSTEKSFSIGTDQGEVLIPQVVNGKVVSKDEAIQHYKDTGEHLGIFETPDQANAYAGVLHQRLGVGPEWTGNPPPPTLEDRAAQFLFGITPAQRAAAAQQAQVRLAAQAQAEPLVAPWAKPYVEPLVEKTQAAFETGRQLAGEGASKVIAHSPPIWAATALLPPSNPIRQIAEGLPDAAKQFTLTMTEPDNLALMAATGGAGVAGKMMSAVFYGQMASTLPDQWQAFKDAPDLKTKTSIAAQALGTMLFMYGAGKHAVGEAPIPGVVPRLPGGGRGGFGLEDINVPGKELSPEQQAIVDQTNATLAAAEQTAPAAPTAPAAGPLITETARVQPGGAATADVTRAILDRRNALVGEAQQLGAEADISRRMGQPVHPAIESRLAEINLELNQPIRGSLERAFPGKAPEMPEAPAPVTTAPEAPAAAAAAPEAPAPVVTAPTPTVEEPTRVGTRGQVVPAPIGEPVPVRYSIDPTTGRPYVLPEYVRQLFQPRETTSPEFAVHRTRLEAEAGGPVDEVHLPQVRKVAGGGPRSSAERSVEDAQTLAKIYSKGVSWYRGRDGLKVPIRGFSDGNKIFLNVDMLEGPTGRPVHLVAAHEIAHSLERTHPELYNELLKHAQLKAGDYLQRLVARGYMPGELKHEMVADLVADALSDPTRLRQALGERPGVFQRVATYIRDFIDRTLRKVGARKDASASGIAQNLKAARADIMRVLQEVRVRRGRGEYAGGEPTLARDEARFAREEPGRGPIEQGLDVRAIQERAASRKVARRKAAGEARGVVNEDSTLISTRRPTSVNALEDPFGMGADRLHLGVERLSDPHLKEFQGKIADKLRPWMPKELRDRNDARQIENAINFFKENKLVLHRLAEQQPWLERAMRQYEGYNIHGHNLVKQYGFTPEGVFGAETVMSSGKSPDASFSMAERLMQTMREASNLRWDKRFDQTVKENGIPIARRYLNRIRGKTFNELTDPTLKAMWARVYDQAFHRPEYHVITPEGTRGPVETSMGGKPTPITWTSFPEIAKALKLLDGTTKPNEVIETAKHSNYYNSKRAPGSHTPDYVADRHDVSGSYLMPLGSHPTIEGKAHPLLTDHFSGLYNALTGDYGIHALHVEAGRRAAAEAGLTPSDFQAGHWSYQRGFMAPRVLGENASRQIQDIWKDTYSGKRTIENARAETLRIARDALAEKIRKTGYDPTPAWAREPQGPRGADIASRGVAGQPEELPGGRGAQGAAGPGGRGRVAPGAAEGPVRFAREEPVPGPQGVSDEAAERLRAVNPMLTLERAKQLVAAGYGPGALEFGDKKNAQKLVEQLNKGLAPGGYIDREPTRIPDAQAKLQRAQDFIASNEREIKREFKKAWTPKWKEDADVARFFRDNVAKEIAKQEPGWSQEQINSAMDQHLEDVISNHRADNEGEVARMGHDFWDEAVPELAGNVIDQAGGPPTRFAREEPPTQEELQAASESGDREKMRGHIATIQRMTEVSPDVKARVQSWYDPTTLAAVNGAANRTIDRVGLDRAKDTFMRSRTNDVTTLALGHNLALRYDSQGHYEDAADVRDKMAEKLTTPAQSLWYISTIGKTSPEGLIRTAQKLMTDQVAQDPVKRNLLEQISRLRAQLAALPEGKAKDAATSVVIRQLAKVDKPGQRISQEQLNKLLEQHRQGQLGEDQLAQTLNKYFKIPRLSPENRAKILAAQKAWNDTPADNPLLKLKRAGDMMDSVYGLVPRTFWEKVRAASVISMILHGKLPIRIGISNTIKLAGQTLVDTIQNIPADMGNVFSGRRTVTGGQLAGIVQGLTEPVRAYRAGYRDAKLRGLSTPKSFSEGMRSLIDLANLTTRGLYEATDVTRATHTFSSRVGRLFEDTVTLVHNVVPYAFWNAAFKSSLMRQMRLARVETPTADMVTNAQIDGNKAIFYNDTALSKGLIAVRKTLDMPTAKITGGKYGLGTATIPFAKVPSAIITEGLAWTPFGLTKAGWEILRPHVTGEPMQPRAVGEAIIKAALGTGSALLAGYQLAKIGVLTGAPDDNKELEAMRRASGWGAYRINLSELKRRMSSGNWWTRSPTPADGDLITNYNWLEPVAFTVAMGADIAHSQDKREIDLKRGKITSNAVLSALGAGFQSVTEAPMLQGIQHFMAAAGEGRWGNAMAGIFANVPGNFVPSLIRQTSQKMDNTVRETQGGTILDQEANKILVQIPGLSQRYPVNYDVFGEAMQRYNYGNNSLLNVFFNPAMVSRFKANPELAEMQRIYETTGANKASLRQVPQTLMINGKQVQLTNEQVSAYQHYVGKEASTVIARLMASPPFAGEPLLTKQAVISQVLGAVNNAAKMDLFGQAPVTVGVGARGPTLSRPSPMDIGALLGARQQGLNRPPGAQPAGPLAPAWQTVPQPALPSLAP